MKYTKFEILKIKTNNTMLLWKDVYGIASNASATKLNKAMLEWHKELTDALEIWINKGLAMSSGELILACANLGAVVESWLKFFYCVYYDDYRKKPITKMDKNHKRIKVQPEDAEFDDLKKFSTGKLWSNKTSKEYLWVGAVQHKRNAIHSFKYRDVGTAQDFLDDIDHLYDFVDSIIFHLPPLEECIESYPDGYIHISPFFF